MTPSNTMRVQDTVFDLDTFAEITLVKDVPKPSVATVDEALEMLANDSAKLISVINKGLESEARKAAKNDPSGFKVLSEDGEVGGDFAGTPADITKVNSLVLTMAKTVFGFSKDQTPDEKRAAKDSAKAMIQGNAQIREGLKKTAALGSAADGE